VEKTDKIIYIPGLNSKGINNEFTTKFGAEVFNYNIKSNQIIPEMKEKVKAYIEKGTIPKIIGNSFGGWIAFKLNLIFDIPVFLINPVTDYKDMEQFIGEQTNFDTGEKYDFDESIISYIKSEDNKYADTMIEHQTINVAIGLKDEILDPYKFINTYNIFKVLRLPNEGHRIKDKSSIYNSDLFKKFINEK